MSASVVLSARSIVKSYGRRAVLRGVSFDVAPGTLVGIVGENGAGKSTLLRILAGDLHPSSGAITLRGRIGHCPQSVVLDDTLTVNQHLDYFRAAYHLADAQVAARLVERLDFGQYRDAPVGTLSGGTRQKLNLTISLMHSPDVLLLDEPYQGFDWETYLRFWDLAAELRNRGTAVLVISHLLFDQQRFDHLYALRAGHIADMPPAAA